MMHYEYLAAELVGHIFASCTSIADVLALSSACRRYREIYNKQRLFILAAAAEHQYGPLQDSIQLLTHNDSQSAHVIRHAPVSFALLKQIVAVGRVAEKWTALYPFKRWRYDFEDRRLLSSVERYRIRRAVYRIWLYGSAFHNRQHSRHTRYVKEFVQERVLLLHNWTTPELIEIADVRRVMRDVVAENVCPSNGTIARKWRKRFPDETSPHPLMFNIHLNYPLAARGRPVSEYHNPYPSTARSATDDHYYQHRQPRSTYSWSKYQQGRFYEPGTEGWGDDISHYYIVEDVLKLNPAQILFLKENVKFKCDVEAWLRCFASGGALPSTSIAGIENALGAMTLGAAAPACLTASLHVTSSPECSSEWAWFDNNGETWSETLRLVLDQRDVDMVDALGEDGHGFGGSWGVLQDDEEA